MSAHWFSVLSISRNYLVATQPQAFCDDGSPWLWDVDLALVSEGRGWIAFDRRARLLLKREWDTSRDALHCHDVACPITFVRGVDRHDTSAHAINESLHLRRRRKVARSSLFSLSGRSEEHTSELQSQSNL